MDGSGTTLIEVVCGPFFPDGQFKGLFLMKFEFGSSCSLSSKGDFALCFGPKNITVVPTARILASTDGSIHCKINKVFFYIYFT